ncbi:hypothetical protein COB64_00035 [Candidatus Wolfebacteria bacterium]|nr:MAG: hypothetical protein COB64_00035 [Candidatus Wolfebacteria bacterium]
MTTDSTIYYIESLNADTNEVISREVAGESCHRDKKTEIGRKDLWEVSFDFLKKFHASHIASPCKYNFFQEIDESIEKIEDITAFMAQTDLKRQLLYIQSKFYAKDLSAYSNYFLAEQLIVKISKHAKTAQELGFSEIKIIDVGYGAADLRSLKGVERLVAHHFKRERLHVEVRNWKNIPSLILSW